MSKRNPTNTNLVALERVAKQFEHWRATRASRREPIPRTLLDQARALREHYPVTLILTSLCLNSATLKPRTLPKRAPKQVKTTAFVEVVPAPPVRPVTARVHRGDRWVLEIEFDQTDPQTLGRIIGAFTQGA